MTTPQPCRCPVCEGRGTMPALFYDPYFTGWAIELGTVMCRTCKGEGIVWPPSEQKPLPSPRQTSGKIV